MTIKWTHPSLTSSIGAFTVFAAASTVTSVPWPLWTAWASR